MNRETFQRVLRENPGEERCMCEPGFRKSITIKIQYGGCRGRKLVTHCRGGGRGTVRENETAQACTDQNGIAVPQAESES